MYRITIRTTGGRRCIFAEAEPASSLFRAAVRYVCLYLTHDLLMILVTLPLIVKWLHDIAIENRYVHSRQ